MQVMTLDKVFAEAVERSPDRTFIDVIGEGAQTYLETYDRARRIGASLQALGMRSQDPVIVMGSNCLTSVNAWLGITLGHGIDVSINTAYRGALLKHAVNTIGAAIILIERQYLGRLRELEADLGTLKSVVVWGDAGASHEAMPPFERLSLFRLEDVLGNASKLTMNPMRIKDVASIIFTSGTTGPAKGVMMPHGQIARLAAQTVRGVRLSEADRFFCAHPLYHMAGKFMALYGTMRCGGTAILDSKFSASTWARRIRDSRATATIAHGPMVEMICREPERADDGENDLRAVVTVPLPASVGDDFKRRFGVKTIDVWGMTEVNVPCWQPYDGKSPKGSCGVVDNDELELKIVDPETDEEVPAGEPGEIIVRPRHPWSLMQGYYGAPDKTVETWRNLWFHTGDVARRDAAGFVYILDRLGDRIRRRSENISSYDIESALATHPSVVECAAVGVPSEFEGDDDVKVFVVPKDETVDPVTLLTHCVERMPHFMVPRYIEFIDALPRTPTNKVKKQELRNLGNAECTWDRKAAGIALRSFNPAGTGDKLEPAGTGERPMER